jgi:hypothetical protein
MKLSEKQAIFTLNTAKLILWADAQGYKLTYGEAYRPKEMAEIYYQRGIGIKNSQHGKRLAVDFNLFCNGRYMTDSESYARLGIAWQKLHEDNRWGGNFPDPDGNHFEMQG